jgi:oxalate decarboxylase/phosphoglucose isomerase-like protein (cupin superfamily)
VGAGETLYVPSNWWHATLNLDEYGAFTTVFVREAEASVIT